MNEFKSMLLSTPQSQYNWGTGIILQHPITNKILLAKRVDNGQYGSPGGKVEYGETPRDGILRECMEESNIGIRHMSCYDVHEHNSPTGKPWTDFLFYSQHFDDNSIINQESEMEDFNWYDVEDALNMDLFDPCRYAIQSAIKNGLLTGNSDFLDYIYFVDCPTSASQIMDSPCCQYSYSEPETIFTPSKPTWLEWD